MITDERVVTCMYVWVALLAAQLLKARTYSANQNSVRIYIRPAFRCIASVFYLLVLQTSGAVLAVLYVLKVCMHVGVELILYQLLDSLIYPLAHDCFTCDQIGHWVWTLYLDFAD